MSGISEPQVDKMSTIYPSDNSQDAQLPVRNLDNLSAISDPRVDKMSGIYPQKNHEDGAPPNCSRKNVTGPTTIPTENSNNTNLIDTNYLSSTEPEGTRTLNQLSTVRHHTYRSNPEGLQNTPAEQIGKEGEYDRRETFGMPLKKKRRRPLSEVEKACFSKPDVLDSAERWIGAPTLAQAILERSRREQREVEALKALTGKRAHAEGFSPAERIKRLVAESRSKR